LNLSQAGSLRYSNLILGKFPPKSQARISFQQPVRATVFSNNRDRLLSTAMSRQVMAAIPPRREVAPLLPNHHLPVDGTLVKGEPPKAPPLRGRWRTSSMKSFRPKTDNGPPEEDPGGPNGPESPTEIHPDPA
jgi:hypothetical protein